MNGVMRWALVGVASLLLGLGCESAPPAADAAAGGSVEPASDGSWVHPGGVHVPVTSTSSGSASLVPGWALEPGTRTRQRIDIDQLAASIERVTGGLTWHEGSTDLFEELSATLGKPDYATNTIEDLAPSLLFQKFLDDAARLVCDELLTLEGESAAADRVFLVHVEPDETPEQAGAGVGENLAYLLLRFHGVKVEATSPRLESWRWLLETTWIGTGDTLAAWRNVCATLITHPDFYSY